MLNKNLLIIFFLLFSITQINSQWVKTNGPNTQYTFALLINGNTLFAATDEGIYITTNNGTSWTKKNSGLLSTLNNYYSLLLSDSKIITGSDSGIYVSTNNGDSWTQKSTGLSGARIFKAFLKYNSTSIYAASNKGVFLSTDNGETWTARNTGLENSPIFSFTVKNNNIYAGSERKIYKSSDAGLSWVSVSIGLPSAHTDALSFITAGPNLLVGLCCGAGLYMSTNDGERWEKVHDMTANVMVQQGNYSIAGSIEGIYVSSDNGYNWTTYNEGLQFLTTTALAYNSTKIFAGVELFVWYRPLGQLIGVKNISSEVPENFSLSQNYPNPFNPSTKIKFDIPSNMKRENSNVMLSIYDILGKEVTTLVNEKLSPGTYEVEWDASNYSSGIYYYKLMTGSYNETKKMMLLK